MPIACSQAIGAFGAALAASTCGGLSVTDDTVGPDPDGGGPTDGTARDDATPPVAGSPCLAKSPFPRYPSAKVCSPTAYAQGMKNWARDRQAQVFRQLPPP